MAVNDGKEFTELRTNSGDSLVDDTNDALRVNVVTGSFSVSSTPSTDATRVYAAGGWPLPSGAATETTLTTLNNKVPSQGQAAMAASVPVVIASNQSAIPVTGSFSSTPSTDATRVYASTGWPLPSGAATAALQTQPGVDIGDVTVNNGSGASAVNIQDGGNSITVDGALSITPSTDPTRVFATTGWPLPSGASTEATLLLANTAVQGISGAVYQQATGTITKGILSMGYDTVVPRAVLVDTSGKIIVSSLPGNPKPIFVSNGLPLPSGASTEATLSTLNTKVPSLGQALMAASTPVAIASNQSALPITDNSGSLTVDGLVTVSTDNPIRVYAAGGWPLPSGASTSALQTQPGVDIGDVTINNASGGSAVNIQDGGNSITVDGTVAISNELTIGTDDPIRIYAATGLPLPSGASQGLAEDAAHVSGDIGVMALSVRNDSGAVLTSQNLDYSALTSDSQGNLRANFISGTLTSALPAGTNVIGHVIVDTTSTTAVTQATGTNLHMVVDSGTITTVASVTAIAGALPAGSNAIGKLAANSGVDIGDVDVTSISAGDNNIGNVDIVTVPAPLSTAGGGTEATAHRVTIASDSTGVLSVDDNGGSLTVDGSTTIIPDHPIRVYSTGTWPLPSGASTEATLLLNTTATQGISGAVYQQATGSITKGMLVMGYDSVVPRAISVDTSGRQVVSSLPGNPSPVYISSGLVLPSGAATETSLSSALTAIQGISGTVYQDGVGGISKGILMMGYDSANPQAFLTDTSGRQIVAHGKSIKTVTGTVSVDTDIVAAVVAKKIKVIAYGLFSGATTLNTITFQSNASTALWTVPLQAPASNSIFGANLATTAPTFLFGTTAGEKLTLDVSSANNVTYNVTYFDDDAS